MKYSGLPKRRIKSVKSGVAARMMLILINPPINEDVVDIARAVIASPCFDIGYPSSVVTAEEVVPGTFNRIAEIEPPYVETTNVLPNNKSATGVENRSSSGMMRIITISGPNPGMTPKTSEMNIPINKITTKLGVTLAPNALINR
jgi:hypothetical protein